MPELLKYSVVDQLGKCFMKFCRSENFKKSENLINAYPLLAGEANNFKSQSQQKGMGLGAQVNL